MDALEAFGDDGLHAQQQRALRGPVARRSRPIFFARDDKQRDAGALVFHRRVVNRHHVAARLIRRPTAFGARRQLIAEADVGECSAHHHFMVAAACAVRVEVVRLHAVLDQIFPGRAVFPDRSCR